jgi:hypothetical protein
MTVRRDAALAVGGFCPTLRLAEDREFLIRLAQRGSGRLLTDVLWEKSWVDDSLSNDWHKAGAGLMAYLRQRPEYGTRFPAIASYLATKILVSHVRDRRLRRALARYRGLFGPPASSITMCCASSGGIAR